jgi:hypothetical protein
MSEIFLPKDPLLRSAGVFPVYYWFVRENDAKQDQYVREFLNAFEKARKENREVASVPENAARADSELLTFDRFNRSTDLGDHLKAAIRYHFKTGHREAA